MGSTVLFKRLFEVQILHDYYLTNADGVSFFDQNQADKNELISKKLTNRIYDVKDLFEIGPDAATQSKLSRNKLVWAQTTLGFIVGTEVSIENKAEEILYKPRFEFEKDLNFTFSLKTRASFLKSVSNIGLRPPMPFIYYFSNKDKEEFNENTVPAYTSLPISNKVSAHQKLKNYEMGALADFSGTIKEALQYTTGNNPSHWETIEDKRFVNEADQILLPHKFKYTIARSQNVTEIALVLLDKGDNEVKTIVKTATKPIENIAVDLSKVDENDEKLPHHPFGILYLKKYCKRWF